jgi:hypothetical protein
MTDWSNYEIWKIENIETPKDKATGDFSDSVKGRAVAVSPDGAFIVLGFKDGTVREFSVTDNGDNMTVE